MITDGAMYRSSSRMPAIRTEKVYAFILAKPHNNEFMVANQFTVIEHGVEKRPDIVVFINGIPLVVIELKSISDENVDISDAYNQLQTYKMTIPSVYVQFLSSDKRGINAKAGTLTEDRFMAWRTFDGDDVAPQSIPNEVIKGMFQHNRFLDIIRHFVLFQNDGKE